MVNYIRVKNLRSLKDTGEIQMKKLNLLVGNNSSGKSTFLRVFPLFKQSFQKKINGPILWCGDDDDYVDFGSFAESINYKAQDDAIRFIFECNMSLRADRFQLGVPYHIKPGDGGVAKIEFAIQGNVKTGIDYISELNFTFREYYVEIALSAEKKVVSVVINEEKLPLDELEYSEMDMVGFLWEHIIFDISLQPVKRLARRKISEYCKLDSMSQEEQSMLTEACIGYMYEKEFSDTKRSKQRAKYEEGARVREIVEQAYARTSNKELTKWVLMYYLPVWIANISDDLRAYFSNVYYIAPVRATAERYYRLRNSSVNEVDCRGKNLPIFLNSLGDQKFQKFQEWTEENLGFGIEKVVGEGHVSLQVRKKGQSRAVNLSDAGFGYSQILPIVTQLWYLVSEGYKTDNRLILLNNDTTEITVVIEQPELHLHPALQAKLIDIIVKIAGCNKVKFVIETHSEKIIERIGSLIDEGKINCDDVGIYIFDKGFGDDDTTVKKSSFDQGGFLQDWPIGFFEPEEV